jgi:motility quorum-sensing regulator / GCU-specific mRNA interferase toxin
MGRGGPTYDLHEIQRLVGQGPISSSITKVAREGALVLGWQLEEIVEAVLELTPDHFFKTMESEKSPGFWQDVYHLEFRGTWMYIKLQLGSDGRAFVVQFKGK